MSWYGMVWYGIKLSFNSGSVRPWALPCYIFRRSYLGIQRLPTSCLQLPHLLSLLVCGRGLGIYRSCLQPALSSAAGLGLASVDFLRVLLWPTVCLGTEGGLISQSCAPLQFGVFPIRCGCASFRFRSRDMSTGCRWWSVQGASPLRWKSRLVVWRSVARSPSAGSAIAVLPSPS